MRKVLTKEDLDARVENAIIPDNPDVPLDEFQAAKLLGCSVHTLRRARWAGDGIPYLKLGGLVRYQRQDIVDQKAASLRRSTSEHGVKPKAA